jgi:hypothetical protein
MFRWIDDFLRQYQVNDNQDCIVDKINQLNQRIETLERDGIINLSRIEELERENISSINAMYEISNSLEARIDMLSTPVLNFDDNPDYTVEHL